MSSLTLLQVLDWIESDVVSCITSSLTMTYTDLDPGSTQSQGTCQSTYSMLYLNVFVVHLYEIL